MVNPEARGSVPDWLRRIRWPIYIGDIACPAGKLPFGEMDAKVMLEGLHRCASYNPNGFFRTLGTRDGHTRRRLPTDRTRSSRRSEKWPHGISIGRSLRMGQATPHAVVAPDLV